MILKFCKLTSIYISLESEYVNKRVLHRIHACSTFIAPVSRASKVREFSSLLNSNASNRRVVAEIYPQLFTGLNACLSRSG